MSYASIADMASDAYLRERIAACAAVEGEPDPVTWTQAHAWAVAAQPGWADKWDAALAGGIGRPGADPAVITDADILAAVQAVRAPAVEPDTGT